LNRFTRAFLCVIDPTAHRGAARTGPAAQPPGRALRPRPADQAHAPGHQAPAHHWWTAT